MGKILEFSQVTEVLDKGFIYNLIKQAFLDGHTVYAFLDLLIFKDFQTAAISARIAVINASTSS